MPVRRRRSAERKAASLLYQRGEEDLWRHAVRQFSEQSRRIVALLLKRFQMPLLAVKFNDLFVLSFADADRGVQQRVFGAQQLEQLLLLCILIGDMP